MSISRYSACLALGAVWGCADRVSAPEGPQAAAPLSSVSFDGRYEGTVQVVGVASGVDPKTCATDPRLSLQVTNNSFIYAQPHPNAAGTSPSLTVEKTTATYTATIAPDGTITDSSPHVGTTIVGRVTGSHMSGSLKGLLCSYAFTADRTGTAVK